MDTPEQKPELEPLEEPLQYPMQKGRIITPHARRRNQFPKARAKGGVDLLQSERHRRHRR